MICLQSYAVETGSSRNEVKHIYFKHCVPVPKESSHKSDKGSN